MLLGVNSACSMRGSVSRNYVMVLRATPGGASWVRGEESYGLLRERCLMFLAVGPSPRYPEQAPTELLDPGQAAMVVLLYAHTSRSDWR